MKNSQNDFSNQGRYTRYYGLNDFPEAKFLMEAECFDTQTDTTTKNTPSAFGIIFGLGIFATLLIFSFFQLSVYRFVSKELSEPKLQLSHHLDSRTTRETARDYCSEEINIIGKVER